MFDDRPGRQDRARVGQTLHTGGNVDRPPEIILPVVEHDREAWPLVVRGREVIAVPGIIEADGVHAVRVRDDATEGAEYPDAVPEEGGSRAKHGFPRESEPKAKRNAD